MPKKKPVKKKVSERLVTKKRGPKPKYPLDEWFNGRWHTLRFGLDFKANLKSMINHLYKVARQHDKEITIVSCLEIVARPKRKVGRKRA